MVNRCGLLWGRPSTAQLCFAAFPLLAEPYGDLWVVSLQKLGAFHFRGMKREKERERESVKLTLINSLALRRCLRMDKAERAYSSYSIRFLNVLQVVLAVPAGRVGFRVAKRQRDSNKNNKTTRKRDRRREREQIA